MAEKLLVVLFISMLAIGSLGLLLFPKQSFSPIENRPLEKWPRITPETIINKKAMTQFETYLSDHFPYRNGWIKTKAFVEQVRGRKENNGIYLGRDGYLFEKVDPMIERQVDRQIREIETFAERYEEKSIELMIIPPSAIFYEQQWPTFAPMANLVAMQRTIMERMPSRVTTYDGAHMLEQYREQYIYYKTDHHWTTRGAYIAYAHYALQQGWEPITYEPVVVSEQFYGSFDTRGQFIRREPDRVERPNLNNKSTLYIEDRDELRHTLYDEEALQQKDQYRYFFGGVHAAMQLKTPDAPIEEPLLVVKDSYAHALLPFLTAHYANIYVLDLRYYNGSVEQYMEDHQIDHILLLWNTTTFLEETQLFKLNR